MVTGAVGVVFTAVDTSGSRVGAAGGGGTGDELEELVGTCGCTDEESETDAFSGCRIGADEAVGVGAIAVVTIGAGVGA